MTSEVCEACNGRGYRDVTYEWRGSVQDGETGCSECCPHARLELISGPGIACADCGSWFKSRESAEREVARGGEPMIERSMQELASQYARLETLLEAMDNGFPPSMAAEIAAQISHAILKTAETLRHEQEETNP